MMRPFCSPTRTQHPGVVAGRHPAAGGVQGIAALLLLHQITPEQKPGPPRASREPVFAAGGALRSAHGRSGAVCTRVAANQRLAVIRSASVPGAEYGPAKRWPLERFAEVAKSPVPQDASGFCLARRREGTWAKNWPA